MLGSMSQLTPQQIDISAMPYEQLVMLKNDFEQEVQGLAQATGTLKVAASRFQNSARALDILKDTEEGNCVQQFCFINSSLEKVPNCLCR
jgi:prefoldin subunit 5